jgi:hypothetical protein
VSEVAIIVEGMTEFLFVRNVLSPHLGTLGIRAFPLPPTGKKSCGGIPAWKIVRTEVLRVLKQRRGRVCTTMFDFYGMPYGWPGRDAAATVRPDCRGAHVEKALLDDLAAYAGEHFRPDLFIPYVQMHEFEALLFSDSCTLAEVLCSFSDTDVDGLKQHIGEILRDAGEPEAINDNYHTCPSRRIICLARKYTKPLGPIIAGRIGLPTLRKQCRHFGQWLASLESLAPAAG